MSNPRLEYPVFTQNIRVIKAIAVIAPTVIRDETYDHQRLVATAKHLIQLGYKYLILDLKDRYLTGSSTGALVDIYNALHNIGGELRLCCMDERLTTKLKMQKLFDLFKTYPTRKAAMDSFRE